MSDQQKQPRPLTAIIGEAEAKCRFANQAVVANAADSFLFEFYFVHGNAGTAHLQSRISLTPLHAKRFLQTLAQRLEQYERQFGEIRPPSKPEPKIGFAPPPPPKI